jgi:P-type Mg2+ transporter
VIFIIRTSGSPFRSRPATALVVSTVAIVAAALALPFSPLGPLLGFVPLPGTYFLFLAGATVTDLLLVEIAKRALLRRLYD